MTLCVLNHKTRPLYTTNNLCIQIILYLWHAVKIKNNDRIFHQTIHLVFFYIDNNNILCYVDPVIGFCAFSFAEVSSILLHCTRLYVCTNSQSICDFRVVLFLPSVFVSIRHIPKLNLLINIPNLF